MDPNNQSLIKAAIVIILIAGILGALSIFAGGIDFSTAKIGSICFLLLLFGITGTAALVVASNPAYRTLGTAGIFTSGAGFLLFTIMILGETSDTEILKIGLCLLVASLGLGHICFLYHINVQNKYAFNARIGAVIAVSLFSLLLIVQIFQPLPNIYLLAYNQSTLKLVTALLFAELAATLLVPLCNRLKVPAPVQELTFIPEPPETKEEEPPAP